MDVLIDSNIVLDFILRREPHADNAMLLVEKLIKGKTRMWLTASTITDIYYVTQRTLRNNAVSKNTIEKLLNTFQIAAVDKNDCLKALDLDISDYEDALVSVCAQKAKAEYIITRNVEDFGKSPVPALSPQAFLKQHNSI